ncbi:MAG: protein of unknown function (DUF4384) [Candidatus Kentron sp. G]|nr:MAG: protein of unknown function (DUF4384) [Candidatus Kentron sp. G]VFM99429.1 MAG: protein of unknown function (DUF4384) [Candidatus Kentron sp. G]VFN01551.1 MAG: protein of unknown function (DUF4384) [Candidatus Kentron sp. G]
MKRANLFSTPSPGGQKIQWRRLEELADSTGALPVKSNQPRFSFGDTLTLEVEIPFDGYLNVVSVGPRDEPDILYPNQWHPENRVSTGVFRFPTHAMDFDLRVGEPAGENIIVAVLSKDKINLYQSAVGQRDGKGIREAFGRLSPYGLYELTGGGAKSSFTAGQRREQQQKKIAGKVLVTVAP